MSHIQVKTYPYAQLELNKKSNSLTTNNNSGLDNGTALNPEFGVGVAIFCFYRTCTGTYPFLELLVPTSYTLCWEEFLDFGQMAGVYCTVLTMILECFHLVSLLSIRRRLMQENMLRQQYTENSGNKVS